MWGGVTISPAEPPSWEGDQVAQLPCNCICNCILICMRLHLYLYCICNSSCMCICTCISNCICIWVVVLFLFVCVFSRHSNVHKRMWSPIHAGHSVEEPPCHHSTFELPCKLLGVSIFGDIDLAASLLIWWPGRR